MLSRPAQTISLLLLFSSTAAVHPGHADQTGPGALITGFVVAADGISPVPNAIVELTRISPYRGAHPALASDVADRNGRYEFADVPAGRYRVQARRIGFAPTVIDVTITDNTPVRLSLALERNPIRLTPVDVVGRVPRTPQPLSAIAEEEDRRVLIRGRQEGMVSSDSREITAGDMAEAVALGETDILRTIQMVPGMATKSDWTAELWTRGGRWDQTRVLFDGVPVFNPLHTFGIFTAVNAHSVGAVSVHPGARSASLGAGAAGVIEMESASAAALPTLSWNAAVSNFQASGSVRQPLQGERGGLMISGRTGNLGFRNDAPYRYGDVAGRLDVGIGPATLSGSLLWTGDDVRRPGQTGQSSQTAEWSNAIGRLAIAVPVGSAIVTHSLASAVAEANAFERRPNEIGGDLSWPTDNSIRQFIIRGEAEPAGGSESWSVGYEVQTISTHFFGSPTAPYAYQTFQDTLSYEDQIAVGAIWAEKTWQPLANLSVRTGLRVELDRRPTASSTFGVAPRLAVRFAPSDRLSLTSGYARSFQYAQALEGSGAVIGPGLQISHVWLLAGPQVPLLESSILTLGAEYWLTPDWLSAINVYRRTVDGMVLADPRPGYRESRHLFATASNAARGLELSVRKVHGRSTAAFSYSLAGSTVDAFGMSFPSTAERRHVFQATVRNRLEEPVLSGDVHVSFATRVASGAPFTRMLPCPEYCAASAGTSREGGEANPVQIAGPDFHTLAASSRGSEQLPTHRGSSEWIGEPNAWRTPSFWSVDAQVDWTRNFNRARIQLYMQLRNVFDRLNAVTYIRAGQASCGASGTAVLSIYGDCFEPGIPFRPVFGMRISH